MLLDAIAFCTIGRIRATNDFASIEGEGIGTGWDCSTDSDREEVDDFTPRCMNKTEQTHHAIFATYLEFIVFDLGSLADSAFLLRWHSKFCHKSS